MSPLRTYGARSPGFKPAPRPTNLDAMTAAAAAGDSDAFQREHDTYGQQAMRAGVHPGILLGVLDDEKRVS